MRRAAALLPTVLCAARATACATSRPTAGGGTRLESSRAARVSPVVLASRSMIPQETLDIDPSLSMLDVVGRYWPQVLRPLAMATTPPDPRGDVVGVFVNGNFSGGQDALRSIRASAVASIRRLSRTEEYAKWGMSHPGGALVITLR